MIETTELAAEASATLTVAQSFKIANTGQFIEAGERLKGIKGLMKKIDDVFDPHIKRAHDAHKALVIEKKAHQTPLQTAEALLKRAITVYQIAEEQKRRELEARAQEEARKQREKLEAQAAKAAEKGKTEKAEALTIAAASVVAPLIAPTTPKVSGISMRTTYSHKVRDMKALVDAVSAGKVPLMALLPNTTFLNQQARAMRDSLDYPGVDVIVETGIASRSA
jgi:hypothetical protein